MFQSHLNQNGEKIGTETELIKREKIELQTLLRKQNVNWKLRAKKKYQVFMDGNP